MSKKHWLVVPALLAALVLIAAQGSCLTVSSLTPGDYQIAPLAEGSAYHTDSSHTITSVPLALAGGTLIRTEAADASNPGLVVSFNIDVRSEVYVCYDSRAGTPSWLSSWVNTGMDVGASDPAVGHYKVYAKRFAAGTVQLSANQADAMYFVVVKESLPILPRVGWVLLSYDMPYLREVITKAPEYGVNHLQISHDIMMETWEVMEQPTRRAHVNELIDLAHAYGVTEVTLWTHEVNPYGLPSQYCGGPDNLPDGNNPGLWTWVTQRYVDLFSSAGCPEADGIILTLSEVDANVYDRREFKHDGYELHESVAMLVNTVQQVLAPRGKSLYVRTWVGADKWAEEVIRDGIALNGDSSVWMMNKNIGGTDWLLMDTFHAMMGTLPPEYNEMIEYDLGFEYSGLSRSTSCMTSYLKEHWNYALDRGVDGAVARIDRDGELSYYTSNRLNLYALKEVVANPDVDPLAVNLAWCQQRFPAEAAQDIADHYDDPNSQWEGDTRYMMWEAYADSDCPLNQPEALAIAYAAIERVDRHYVELSLQTTLNTRGGKNDFETLHNGIADAILQMGGTVPDCIPPTVPAEVAAAGLSSASIRVTWTASSDNVGVAGYRVYRNGSEVGVSTLTSFTDTGLQPGASYSYTVAAYDAEGNVSPQCSPAQATTNNPDMEPPSVPSNVQAAVQSSTSIVVSWTASTDNVGVSGYRIYRDGSQVGISATTSYTNSGLQPGATYLYEVSAYDGDGNNSARSSPPAIATTTADTQAPSVPSGVQAAAISANAISLKWNASTDAGSGVKGYKIYRGVSQVGNCASTNYIDTGLVKSTTYSYRISAYDVAGNTSAQSSPSASATTLAGWAYTSSSPLRFEFADNGNNFYDDPGGDGDGALLPYDTYANAPHSGAKFCWGYTDPGWRHTFSSAGTGSLTLQSNGNIGGRSLAFARHNVDGNQFTITGLDWTKGVDLKIRAKSIGDLQSAYWPSGYTWGGNYSTGGAEYNFYTLGGNPVGAPSGSDNTGLVLSWQTNDPTTTSDDYVSVHRMGGPAELAGTEYSLGGSPSSPPEHTYRLAAKRSPLPWQQENDLVLVSVYVDDTRVISNRTVETYADDWGNGILIGARKLGASPHGNQYDWVQVFEADGLSDTDRPTSPTGVTVTPATQGITVSWNASTDATTEVIGYRVKRNGAYIAYVEWDQTSYNDTGGSLSYTYDVFAVDMEGNESLLPPISGTASSPRYAGALPIVVTYYGAADRSGTGLKYVHLFYKKGAGGVWTDSGLASAAPAGLFNFMGVSGDDVYCFALQAEDNADNWSQAPSGSGDDYTFYDTTPPTVPMVTDDGAYTVATDRIHASWTSSDGLSYIAEYQYAVSTAKTEVGMIPGGGWQSAGAQAQATRTGLSLEFGQSYYVLVRARDGAGFWSALGASDGITVIEHGGLLIGQAKGLADGASVGLNAKVVTAIFEDCIYVQELDRSAGTKVLLVETPPELAVGSTVHLGGTMGTLEDERCVVNVTCAVTGADDLHPLGLTNRALGGGPMALQLGVWSLDSEGVLRPDVGLSNIALLVKAFGQVTQIDPDGGYFYMNDGADIEDGTQTETQDNFGVRVASDGASYSGKLVLVTGISTCFRELDGKLRRLIRIRQPEDIQQF